METRFLVAWVRTWHCLHHSLRRTRCCSRIACEGDRKCHWSRHLLGFRSNHLCFVWIPCWYCGSSSFWCPSSLPWLEPWRRKHRGFLGWREGECTILLPCLLSWLVGSHKCWLCKEKREATNTNSCETYYRSNNFIVVIDTSRLLQVSVLTLSLKAFVLCLIEEALHDRFFELNWIVDLEGIVANPRDDVIEAVKGAFFQHHVKLPRKCCLSAASSLGQHFSHLSFHLLWF